jgi:tetratricopeptide (TPR) repeat protein
MSRILTSQGREDQGELLLLKLIAEYPRFIPAYCHLAELRLQQGRFDDAVQELSEGLKIAPKDPILLNNAGVCSLLKGDYEAALSSFSMAAEVVPREARYRANMALALGMMGRYDESLNLYEEVLSEKDAAHNLNVMREIRTWTALFGQLESGARTLTGGAEAEQERTEGTGDI